MYDEVLREINKDPEAFIREKKMYAVMALKLQIPEVLRVQRVQRRHHWDSFEQAHKEQKKREAEISYAVKHEKDAITNKTKYGNREARDLEIQERIDNDPAYNRWEKQRAAMYASVKKIEEDIDYYERIDQSLVEIMAMFTAMIAYENSHNNKEYGNDNSAKRASSRARVAARPGEKFTLPT